jgi:hypothetical protein
MDFTVREFKSNTFLDDRQLWVQDRDKARKFGTSLDAQKVADMYHRLFDERKFLFFVG